MSEGLKSCPFCGGEAQIVLNGVQLAKRAWRGYFIRCQKCYCKTTVCHRKNAITVWNTRTLEKGER